MSVLNLTKDETGTLLTMRNNPDFFKAVNIATEETNSETCDAYEPIANWYVAMETSILQSDECFGIDENDDVIPISDYPSHPNPLITRPRFDEN